MLFKIAYKNGNYYMYHKDSLMNDKFNDSSEMIWFVMKFMEPEFIENQNKREKKMIGAQQQAYALEVGEVIKFGRVSYRITRIFRPFSKDGPIINEGGPIKLRQSLDLTQTEGLGEY